MYGQGVFCCPLLYRTVTGRSRLLPMQHHQDSHLPKLRWERERERGDLKLLHVNLEDATPENNNCISTSMYQTDPSIKSPRFQEPTPEIVTYKDRTLCVCGCGTERWNLCAVWNRNPEHGADVAHYRWVRWKNMTSANKNL